LSRPVCLITGVGPGTGAALVHRFAERYDVAMIARDRDRLVALSAEVPAARAYPCDVADALGLAGVLEAVREEMGVPTVLIHNAVGGAWGSILEVAPEILQRNFEVNANALLRLIQALGPDMVARGQGTILATGNTAAYRGSKGFAAFAPTKAAQRILLESAARELGPQGVHVAYVAIDAVIDVPWTRKAMPDKPDDFFAAPGDIAGECFRIAHQPQSTWSFETILRPFGENW
jgi:NAD(P)-dependent dehydrogenase (short-subunit alcohol dehydrogenase family)